MNMKNTKDILSIYFYSFYNTKKLKTLSWKYSLDTKETEEIIGLISNYRSH